MNVPARKAEAFLEKHGYRVRDFLTAFEPGELARIGREARVLLYGASASEQVELWQLIAVTEARSGNLESAVKIGKEALAWFPGNPDLLLDLGVALGHLDREEEALAYFVEAQKVSSTDPSIGAAAACNEALCRASLTDIGGATEAFRRAQQSPVASSPSVLFLLAMVAAELGRAEDAVEYAARLFCEKAGQPRGDEPALTIIDRLAGPNFGEALDLDVMAASTVDALRRAIRTVRKRESEGPPPDMVVRPQVRLDPEAWARFQQVIGE